MFSAILVMYNVCNKCSLFVFILSYVFQVVALICNFSNSNDPATVRLNHGEVETLFHEFGHALHSLLSRTVCNLVFYFLRGKCMGCPHVTFENSCRNTNIFREPEWHWILLKLLQIFLSEYNACWHHTS